MLNFPWHIAQLINKVAIKPDQMPEFQSSRRRSGKERVRVTRACDTCKRKKLRCSGTLPCSLCFRSEIECQYNAGYKRGKIPRIPVMDQERILDLQSPQSPAEEEWEKLQATPLKQCLTPTERQSQAASTGQLHASDNDSILKEPIISEAPDSVPSLQGQRILDGSSHKPIYVLGDEKRTINSQVQEAEETDLEGHYVGPSSGVSFLLRVQKRLSDNLKKTSSELIFNFGDAPLPDYDHQFLVLPPIDEALILVNRYFEFSFPTHRFLHQATVEQWVHTFYFDLQGANKTIDRAMKAVILMVMAQGKQYTSGMESTAGQSVNSNAYFAACENHLSQEKGPVNLISIQARLAQCFYLLSESRMNHCWSLFGTTARLAHAIGLNRRRRREVVTNHIDEECRKRVFWCAYSLDNYLSAALGRPKIFHDEDVDQDFPTCANDSQILPNAILPPNSPRQSLMLASICHAKLSRLISGILRELYGIQQKSLSTQTDIARKYEFELSEWRARIATFLDTPNIELLQITFQRQCSVLNLAYEHAQILLYRPFLLQNLASLGRERSASHSNLQDAIANNVEKCIQAALRTVEMFQKLCQTRRMYNSFWFTHYNVFCAIVVLYVYIIQNWSDPDREYSRYLQVGEGAQLELAKCGTQSSFAQRYVVVLEELRKEAHKITNQYAGDGDFLGIPSPSAGITETVTQQHQGRGTEYNSQAQGHQDLNGWLSELAQDTSPPSCLAGMTGWGDFDSFVLTGLGDLSHLLPGGYS